MEYEIIWNTEGLPMEQANGHYPNETETVTVLSEDEDTLYCTNGDKFSQALIHAYELGAMHHSEEEDYELAEFDSNWEQENK